MIGETAFFRPLNIGVGSMNAAVRQRRIDKVLRVSVCRRWGINLVQATTWVFYRRVDLTRKVRST